MTEDTDSPTPLKPISSSNSNRLKSKNSSNLQPPINNLISTRTARSPSLGNMDLGDTVRGLATMNETKEGRIAYKGENKKLSETSKGDLDLIKKVYLTYEEITYRHIWLNPLLILVFVYLMYFTSGNRTESNPLHQFVAISYKVPNVDAYGKGIKDLSFIFFYMIFFTFLREFLMEVIIKPMTYRWNITSEHRRKRMMEQVYSIIYYGFSGPFGLYIMYHSDLWLFETKTMYRTYPDLTNTGLYKIFYLGQASFWAQQACVLVLQLEKPRKDHKELVFHHIVTLLLIWSSYVFHFTKMGLAVYITMDVSDFFLALSKTLNYLDSSLTVPMFLVFASSWVYLRHYVNIKILWSVLTQFRTEGNYILNYATQQYKCWISLPIVFVLISALQLVNLYWFFLILKIVYNVTYKGIVKDARSDEEGGEDEDEDEDEEEDEEEEDDKGKDSKPAINITPALTTGSKASSTSATVSKPKLKVEN
ncbi:hypothetical protein TBLA_0I00240 [Henningerozyma blattae CBS 6284]|uniref:TLC domain-containing protein n=1 Tax=Henningerozyma blattae (strain ATCC 34711 / CBS 6284 / DSM 70876 / NBRC 10599 / NRRL Y-10934 / UCD 77-7) TaxID=1071380 RepID=I2H8I7_HENB6|nr:hypothetical protein TBLA_0I00240 [Tetrapisispora blattae CBS 6284]CCH62689.1 hypothetical protein TBLA_0I00240 [Tetrapisispora blattae CBS 6284]